MAKFVIAMIVAPISLASVVLATPASAAGCLKGAVVGGVVGHVAGHHGLVGAGAGCAIGHHEANKHAQQQHAAQSAPPNDRQPAQQP